MHITLPTISFSNENFAEKKINKKKNSQDNALEKYKNQPETKIVQKKLAANCITK